MDSTWKDSSPLSKKVKHDHDECDDQHDMNQAAHDLLENYKGEQPDYDQNYSNGEKHSATLRQENSTRTTT